MRHDISTLLPLRSPAEAGLFARCCAMWACCCCCSRAPRRARAAPRRRSLARRVCAAGTRTTAGAAPSTRQCCCRWPTSCRRVPRARAAALRETSGLSKAAAAAASGSRGAPRRSLALTAARHVLRLLTQAHMAEFGYKYVVLDEVRVAVATVWRGDIWRGDRSLALVCFAERCALRLTLLRRAGASATAKSSPTLGAGRCRTRTCTPAAPTAPACGPWRTRWRLAA